ncbi:MAG: DNA adenine methylase [Candidatus Lokiarchaeota archaeon]|nr:DNA adenine methylase [Candidatus Lokiarchaeota archaeon]
MVDVPRPFLKWAGGKRQLIKQFDDFFPNKFNRYIEPFVGGGAILFYLLPRQAIIIDDNEELINCYNVIKKNVTELIESLKKHVNKKSYFYEIRGLDRDLKAYKRLSDVERASRTIFLNRCCYNGLYRVNSKGQFNVPFGKYKNPNFCDEKNLNAVHQTLQGVEIYKGSFETCLEFAKKGDFVYLDPPYHPISNTAYFTSYTKKNFGKESQEKLFQIFQELDSQGCKVMLSNSHEKFILNLYKNYRIVTIRAKRAINSIASKRGEIKETLILNNY